MVGRNTSRAGRGGATRHTVFTRQRKARLQVAWRGVACRPIDGQHCAIFARYLMPLHGLQSAARVRATSAYACILRLAALKGVSAEG